VRRSQKGAKISNSPNYDVELPNRRKSTQISGRHKNETPRIVVVKNLMVSDSSPLSSSSSGDEDEPPSLVLNLNCPMFKHQIKTICTSESDHSKVSVRFQKLTKGRYHEIFVAQCFEDVSSIFEESITLEPNESSPKSEIPPDTNPVWECIIRFPRQPEPPAKFLSEVHTMILIRRNYSTVPVPRIYAINLGNDVRYRVGAQYMIMEKLPGRHLYRIWDKLDLEDKKKATEQVAQVLGVLSGISSNVIGSASHGRDLWSSLADGVGPYLFSEPSDGIGDITSSAGPFTNTQEFLEFFLARYCGSEKAFDGALGILHDFFKANGSRRCLNPPFRLIHGDFDAQNLLFAGGRSVGESDDLQLTGVIDWEYSYYGPVYYLYEYPLFLRDTWEKDPDSEWKAILRKYFVRTLIRAFPKDSEARKEVRECMAKEPVLEFLRRQIVSMGAGLKDDLGLLTEIFIKEVREGTRPSYDGQEDFENVQDIESEDEEN
jgi:Phosphotransferase enzyme family